MGTISLKLPEDVLQASRRCADSLHLSMAAYIRQAVERMNSKDAGVTPGKTFGRGLEESAQRKHARQP